MVMRLPLRFQGFPGLPRVSQVRLSRIFKVSQGFPEFSRVSQGFSEFPTVSQGLPGLPKVSQGFSGVLRVSQGFLRFPRVIQGFPEFALKGWISKALASSGFPETFKGPLKSLFLALPTGFKSNYCILLRHHNIQTFYWSQSKELKRCIHLQLSYSYHALAENIKSLKSWKYSASFVLDLGANCMSNFLITHTFY